MLVACATFVNNHRYGRNKMLDNRMPAEVTGYIAIAITILLLLLAQFRRDTATKNFWAGAFAMSASLSFMFCWGMRGGDLHFVMMAVSFIIAMATFAYSTWHRW